MENKANYFKPIVQLSQYVIQWEINLLSNLWWNNAT